MTPYEYSLEKARYHNLTVIENFDLSRYGDIEGLILGDKIFLSNTLTTDTQKHIILEEEINHHLYSNGNILDQTDISNIHQERTVRRETIKSVLPLVTLVSVIAELEDEATIENIAYKLEVNESFVLDTINFYETSFSGEIILGNYIVYFSPLRVYKVA